MPNRVVTDPELTGHHPPTPDGGNRTDHAAAHGVDFWAVFASAPDAYLLLAPDPPRFTMIAANDARLEVTGSRREDVVGRPLFEVFTDNTDDPAATGVRNLRASLHEVIRTGKPHRMALQKYDLRGPDGTFEDRYWDPVNSPVFDDHGALIYIIHRVEDVTEQVRSGSRLRILESVVTTANDAVMVMERGPLDGHGPRIVYVNAAFTRMTGYSLEEVVGKSSDMLHAPDTDPHIVRQIYAALERREPVRAELLNRRKDGSAYWVDVSIAPVLDESGNVVHFTAVQRDMTERRRAEDTALRLTRETAAHEQEARARRAIETILESITDAFFAVDREWRFTYVNGEAERLLRQKRSALLGRELWEAFPEAVGVKFEHEYRRAVREGITVHFEDYFAPLDAWYDVRAYPAADGLSVYFRDVTRRKRAEAQLRESEARYRLLADMIPQHVWTADATGFVNYASRRWFEFAGMAPEDLVGDWWLPLLHPDDRQLTMERWQYSLLTGEPFIIEYRFRKYTGEYCWFWGHAVPQLNESGQVVQWIGTITDISERKRNEQERERLLAAEREARADAQRRREDLERITESRTRLMRGFSHDVKNPLGAADGFAALLEEGVGGALSEAQRKSVQRIRRSLQVSLRLINDLLELARAEEGQIELKIQRVDVAELAREVAEDFRGQISAAGLTLEVRAGEPLSVESDPTRVRQILSNLVSNAVKYTRKGRVVVDAWRESGSAVPREGEWAAIRVTDTGPGIPYDKRETIFQEFTRLDPNAPHGAGVGLAISRRIACMLGGDVTVESQIGRGSTFTVWLPIAAPKQSS